MSNYDKLQRLTSNNEEAFLRELDYKKPNRIKKTQYQKLQENWRAGITVGLVNLPLCISLAVAGGSTPEAGILSGIWAGIGSGIWGGSNFNIVGPTGALSGFLLVCCERYGAESLPLFAILTGLFCFLVKFYSVERYIDLFPVAVNEGFTVGVAFIIFFGQMNSFLGIGKIEPQAGVKVAEESLIHKVIENLIHINRTKPLVFITFLILIFLLMQAIKWKPTIPWMIIVSVIGIILGASISQYPTLQSVYKDLSFAIFELPKYDLMLILDPRFYADCMPIAFVALLETLISAKIADSMTNTKFNKQRELRGLGLANLFCGIAGGIPVTAALARTALNIKNGATHKYSAVYSSLTVLLLSSVFFSFFKYIPLCIVSVQVCVVAIRMVNYAELHHLYAHDFKNFCVLMGSAIVCIILDPTIGIIFGMLTYYLLFAEKIITPMSEIIVDKGKVTENHRTFQKEEEHFHDIPKQDGNYIVYRMIGMLNFINVDEHKEKILALARKDNADLVISFRYMHLIDLDAVEALKVLVKNLQSTQGFESGKKKLFVTGISKSKLEQIHDKEWLLQLKEKGVLVVDNDIFELIGSLKHTTPH